MIASVSFRPIADIDRGVRLRRWLFGSSFSIWFRRNACFSGKSLHNFHRGHADIQSLLILGGLGHNRPGESQTIGISSHVIFEFFKSCKVAADGQQLIEFLQPFDHVRIFRQDILFDSRAVQADSCRIRQSRLGITCQKVQKLPVGVDFYIL